MPLVEMKLSPKIIVCGLLFASGWIAFACLFIQTRGLETDAENDARETSSQPNDTSLIRQITVIERKQVVTWLRKFPLERLGPIVLGIQGPEEEKRILKAVDFDLAAWVDEGKLISAAETVLIDILNSKSREYELKRVLYAIGWVGTEQSVPTLLNCLNQGDADFHMDVIAALCEIPDERAEHQLGSRLAISSNGQFGVLPSIIVALKEIDTEESIRYLSVAAESDNQTIVELVNEQINRTTPLPKRSTEVGGFF